MTYMSLSYNKKNAQYRPKIIGYCHFSSKFLNLVHTCLRITSPKHVSEHSLTCINDLLKCNVR